MCEHASLANLLVQPPVWCQCKLCSAITTWLQSSKKVLTFSSWYLVICMFFVQVLFLSCACVSERICVYDKVPGNELIGHMSAQMSSLFNKVCELNCHYCQHLTVVLPARWYLVIYHSDEHSQITLYSVTTWWIHRGWENGPVFRQITLKYSYNHFRFQLGGMHKFLFGSYCEFPVPPTFLFTASSFYCCVLHTDRGL